MSIFLTRERYSTMAMLAIPVVAKLTITRLLSCPPQPP
jgi:hypothetical protein